MLENEAAVGANLLPTVVPRVRLFPETILIDDGGYFEANYEERQAPMLQLLFNYNGTLVAASDPGSRVFTSGARGISVVDRDREAEARARYLLESLGAVELACLDHAVAPPDTQGDYVIVIEDDVHAACAFSAYALPQLKRLGWQIEIDPAYRWQLVETRSPWYANLSPDEEADWFSLELGVEIEGQRLNLLPALLDLLDSASSLSSLLRKGRRCIAIPVDDRHYITVAPQKLRVLAQVVLELYDGADKGALHLRADQAPALTRLDQMFLRPTEASAAVDDGSEESHTLTWRGAVAPLEKARRMAAPPEPVKVPRGLSITLRPYQQQGLEWLQHLRKQDVGGILADDMGLGKTAQTIAHLLVEHQSGRSRVPSLVVAPTSLVGNWRREIERFAPALRATVVHGANRRHAYRYIADSDVVITTYPLVCRDIERLKSFDFHCLVLDEAQTIKNATSQTYRSVMALNARYRLCLTGTPLENHLGELWSLFSFLMPGYLGDAARFRNIYRIPIERNSDSERLQALRHRVAPFILRRTKDKVATELPPKTEIVRAVELRGAQRELYESIRIAAHAKVRHAIAEKGMARSTVAILDALMKLRQVCCDPRLVKVNAARQVEESAKFELLFDLLPPQLEQGRRILIFSQFTSMLALIAEKLRELGASYVSLTGATPDRQQPIDAFTRGFADVFLISLKAGGTGLNLTTADTVIHYDPWWNPAAQAQATDRAYRIGQKRAVFVYNLIIAGSVEERMLQLQQRKRSLADGLLAQGPAAALTENDIASLFEPLSDEGYASIDSAQLAAS